jgi:hypothetical protein
MQTRGDAFKIVGGLVGVTYPDDDWLTPEYLAPKCNLAYDQAIMYLELSCSPYIEKVIIVPNVNVGVDESNLTPFGITGTGGKETTYPLAQLVEPRFVDFRVSGTPGPWKPVKECSILPDTPPQVLAGTFDFRIRGDFRPAPLTTDDSLIEIHPMAAHALAFSIGAAIGDERPNQAWADTYTEKGKAAWDVISAKLTTQMQRETFRLGSPNRGSAGGRGLGWSYNLQANMGFEWRSFGLFVKLI